MPTCLANRGCLQGDVPPEKLKNIAFSKLESCNLMNSLGCKFIAGNELKKVSYERDSPKFCIVCRNFGLKT